MYIHVVHMTTGVIIKLRLHCDKTSILFVPFAIPTLNNIYHPRSQPQEATTMYKEVGAAAVGSETSSLAGIPMTPTPLAQ